MHAHKYTFIQRFTYTTTLNMHIHKHTFKTDNATNVALPAHKCTCTTTYLISFV